MKPRSEPIKLVKAHAGDGDAEFASLVSSDFACHHPTVWQSVQRKTNDVVHCAELCGVVV
jgi:hypothetical protein